MNNLTSLNKLDSNYIGERSIVVHAMKDDLGGGGDAGSIANGNSGTRLACCNIKIVDQDTWDNADADDYLPK